MKVKLNKIYDAHRWFRNGDHPRDDSHVMVNEDGYEFWTEGQVVRYFRRPGVDGKKKCDICSYSFHLHGWIDNSRYGGNGQIVCPGDWVLTYDGSIFEVINNMAFKDYYDKIKYCLHEEDEDEPIHKD